MGLDVFWSPYYLAIAATLLAVVHTLPLVVSGIGLKRWYQVVTIGAWAFLAILILLAVAISSPWMISGLVSAALIVTAVVFGSIRVQANTEEESLGFLRGLIGIMSANNTILQAMRRAAQDDNFDKAFPRMTEATREIIGYVDAGAPLSNAIATVTESAPRATKNVWQQLEMLAQMAEDERTLTVDAQRDVLESLFEVLLSVHNINAEMRREMSQMEAAKWLFSLIIPGLNVYMWFTMPSFKGFAPTTLGAVVFAIEGAALILIFIVTSMLQRFPEVRI